MNRHFLRDALKKLPAICSICLEDDRSLLTADHIVPRSAGGSLSIENVRILCKPCHQRVTNAYRLSRATRVSKEGKVRSVNTWRINVKEKQMSRSNYAHRFKGW